MNSRNIQTFGSVVQVLIVITLLRFAASPRLLLAGVPYLLAASFLALLSLSLATRERKGAGQQFDDASPLLRRRAYVLLLFAWELAILGLFNIGITFFVRSPLQLIGGYVLTSIFVIVVYSAVALADRPDQEGGMKPINYFGRPRSRKIFFLGFIYTPIIPIIILSLAWSGHEWCPLLLRPPNVWLLVTMLLSAMCALLVFQRYRRTPVQRQTLKLTCIYVSCGLTCTTVVQKIFAYSAVAYILSSLAVLLGAMTVYWLLVAKPAPQFIKTN